MNCKMSFRQIGQTLEEKTRTKDVVFEEKVDFKSMLLPKEILAGLTKSNFIKPSPVQLKAIPVGRCGFDLIVKSKSGTGKTAVFAVIALEVVNVAVNMLQALILAPTREIAVQIQDVIKIIGAEIEGLKVESFIGGLPIEKDIESLKLCHIAVGAPGRVKHLITKGYLKTENIKLFVLDEADKLMETEFQKDINNIYHVLPERKQMLVLSATYPDELDKFLSLYMLSPTYISAESDTPLLLGLKQFVMIINQHSNVIQQVKVKNDILHKILSNVSFSQCLIFSNYQTRAESISNTINQKGWLSSYISSAQSQEKRLQSINALKDDNIRILLSTDLTARGIDASNVNLVINYDIPVDPMTYLHRMGRAGRYGSPGLCINLAFEGSELTQLQNILGTIGGTELSIPIIPSFDTEHFVDLWKIELNSLEQLSAKVSAGFGKDYCAKIKANMHEWKENSTKKNHVKNKKKNKEQFQPNQEQFCDGVTVTKECEKNDINVTNNILASNNISQMLDNIKEQTEEIENKYSSQDCLSILHSLTATSELNASVVKNNLDDLVKDDDKLQVFKVQTGPVEDKKRKRNKNETASSIELNKSLHKEKSKPEEETFYKNVALLNISKLLTSDPKQNIDKSITNSIGDYLRLLKDGDYCDKQQIEDNSSLNHEDHEQCSNESINSNDKNNLENIFVLGYNYAVTKGSEHWMNYFSNDEILHFKKLSLNNTTESDDDQDEEEAYINDSDCDMEENDNKKEGDMKKSLKWVPVENEHQNSVEKQGTSKIYNDNNYYNNSYYGACFQQCSDELWNNGLEFETVISFDQWLYEWQNKVMSVRNYIQQNIYIDEMSKYRNHQSKF